MKVAITLPYGERAVDGKQISFVAPCGSLEADGVVIEGVEYTVVDAAGKSLTGAVPAWEKGATVSVVLDTVNAKAYIQNAATNGYLENKFKEIQKLLYRVSVPTQSGALTYTGDSQSPVWNNYNPDLMTMSGDTSAVNVGTYTTTFTLNSAEYMWDDNTSEPKSITWSIKRSIIFSVPYQSGSLTYTGATQTPTWSGYDSAKMTIGGTTSAANAGEYSATFTPGDNYQWNDGTTEAKTVLWSIEKAAIAVPSQIGTLTYTGSEQSPSWSNYDSSKMTLGGTTSGTNAGSYNATFTPGNNYKWIDGTTAAKTVDWSIGKAAGSLSLSKTSMALKFGALTDTITVTRAGDGAITATSSNTSIATVSVSDNIVTVTAKSKGDVTITVKVAEGTNHTAPANKTCAVSVTMPTSTLNDNSWETIREVSDAGQGANYWKVGDTKALTINGRVTDEDLNVTVNAFILGFNHNSAKEGNNRIHFQIGKIGTENIALVDSSYGTASAADGFKMNPSYTNIGGWNGSYGRNTLLGNSGNPSSPPSGSLLAAMPADLLVVMKPVAKYTDNTGNSSNTSGNVTATTDYLFFLSEFEVMGDCTLANQYEQNSQAQYDYYKAGNSKVRHKHDDTKSTCTWWCRSAYYTSAVYFCSVRSDGGPMAYASDASCGLAPGFCV